MDKSELEQIIDMYGNDILSFCHYLTRNLEEAEDLFQDVFLVAFRKSDAVQIGTQIKSFLLQSRFVNGKTGNENLPGANGSQMTVSFL